MKLHIMYQTHTRQIKVKPDQTVGDAVNLAQEAGLPIPEDWEALGPNGQQLDEI